MEQCSILHFRNLLKTNTEDLSSLCKTWNTICLSDELPEEVQSEIRSAIGLTNLLINQKLKQFHGLIDDSEFKKGEKEITCLDLQGFWDMIFVEVEKIHKKFQRLKECQSNNWVFVQENVQKPQPKKKIISVGKENTAAKSHSLAARQRLADFKKKMKSQVTNHNDDHAVIKEEFSRQIMTTSVKSAEKQPKRLSHTNSEDCKSSLVNLQNLNVQEKCTPDLIVKSAATKSEKKTSKRKKDSKMSKLEKENVNTLPVSAEINKISAAKANKEVIPLQCITRSAAKRKLLKST